MTLDDIEKLARDRVVRPCDCVNCMDLDEPDESILARLLLLALPVLRAAEHFSTVYHQHPLNADVIAMVHAVDMMRRGMGE